MMHRIECERIRRGFPEFVDGFADQDPLGHVRDCASCAEELRAFRGALAAAREAAGVEVPDPGETYWESFLPSVRMRIASRSSVYGLQAARSSRWPVAAAAAVMIAVSAGALLMQPPAPPREAILQEASAEVIERELDEAMGRMVILLGPSADMAADLSDLDPVPEIGPPEVLEAIQEMRRPASLAGTWAGEEIQMLLQDLEERQAAELLAELASEKS